MADNQSNTINEREASILAISLGAVAVSLGSIPFLSSEINGTSVKILVFFLGYFSAWFGLFYREITILQTSFEEKMIKDEDSKEPVITLRFVRRVFVRLAQMTPMIIWIFIGNRVLVRFPPHILAIVVLVWIALLLAYIEGEYLWHDNLGPAILFSDSQIRGMIRLADPTDQDTFYDLGCGHGQNLIMFAKEPKVKRCVGIESNKGRFKEAQRRVKKESKEIRARITLIEGDLDDLLSTGILKSHGKTAEIKDASIIFYGLSSDRDDIARLSEHLKNSSKGCKLIYYFNALIPETKADRSIYPFYLSEYPFKEPSSELDWLQTIYPETLGDLWDRLRGDYELLGLSSDLLDYRERIQWALTSEKS